MGSLRRASRKLSVHHEGDDEGDGGKQCLGQREQDKERH